jgi:hypothetical protein
MSTTSKKLSNQFIKGLMEKHKMTLTDLDDWSYCGGDSKQHWNYFKLCNTGSMKQPPHISQCVCYHEIVQNCYIVNKEKNKILVIGNCCIKRFMKNSGRTCEQCGNPHRNRKQNRCNDCKTNQCALCPTQISTRFYFCYTCNLKRNTLIK